jgi:TolB-like protein/Flp pilus assembly protein TadD
LARAAELYRGDLLDGLAVHDAAFEAWLRIERERLRARASQALGNLLERQTGNDAIATGRQLLALDPLKEATHRALIRLYTEAGDRNMAIKQYNACCEVLQAELGLKPETATQQLVEEIQRGGAKKADSTSESIPVETPKAATEPPPLPDKPSLAVLPFVNMSGDPEQDYFSDGITQDIITSLSRFRSLSVISRNSTFSYKGEPTDVRTVAMELGARYIVEGSVRRMGDRVRISVQLVDAEKGDHIWVERYDREVNDIFAVQDEMARMISAAVVPEISYAEQTVARRKPPESLSAWECYQRGLWQIYHFTLEAIVEAKPLFQQAIRLDPDFAAAHSGLAYALYQEWMHSDPENRRPLLDQAHEAAQASIVIDDHDAMAHFVLCRILASRGDFRSACAEGEKAIDLNPSFAYAYFGLGHALLGLRSFEEALKMFETAAHLSPRDPHNWVFIHYQAYPLIGLERYEEAVEVERRALLSPNADFFPYVPLISALGHLGRKEEAKEAIGRLLRLQPGYTCTISGGDVHWDGIDEKIFDGLRRAGLPE